MGGFLSDPTGHLQWAPGQPLHHAIVIETIMDGTWLPGCKSLTQHSRWQRRRQSAPGESTIYETLAPFSSGEKAAKLAALSARRQTQVKADS